MATIKGFFTNTELKAVSADGVGGDCSECNLYKGKKHPRLEYTGKGKKGILVVGESVSPSAERSGNITDGESWKLFRDKLKVKGIDLEEDCWITYAVSCYPGEGKETERKHVKFCKDRIEKTVSELKPRHIWLLGDDAIASFFMDREKTCTGTRWRGLVIPNPDLKAWIVCMHSPNYALKNAKDDHFMSIYDRDVSFAIKCSKFNDIPEAVTLGKCVSVLKTYDDVIRELEAVLARIPEWLAFDYEATGKKPYRKQHKIASMSWCYEYDKAYSCPYEYRKHFTPEQLEHIGDLWIQIMEHPKIKRIAHGAKFEMMWTREIFGCDVHMDWCTMNTAHIIDCRKEFCGLKFQSLIRWGIPDYDSHMDKYLKQTDKSSGPFNRVMEAPLNDLLLYGGIDSLLCFRMREEQEEELRQFRGLQNARAFNMEGLITMCDMQENGIPMNRQYYLDQDVILTKRIAEMKANLHTFPEAVKFQQVKHRPINFGSDADLRTMFFDIMKLDAGRLTGSGMNSVDAAVLAELKTPIAHEITTISKLEKVQNTYLAQFNREIDDFDLMHPFYDLHTVKSHRGSSSEPNFQNIPIRDEEAKMITRSGIIPSIIREYLGISYIDGQGKEQFYIGNQLIDFDYGAMEVRIIACYTQDPVLMKYIFDPTTDMHRDQAIELFKFDNNTWGMIPKKHAKGIRFNGKNGFVFAEFYGSYYKSCAKSLFASSMELECYEGITVFEHMRAVGVIKNKNNAYTEFENHVKKVEERFWHKFREVKKWQEQAWKDYLRLGYIEQKFGHRCQGFLSRNDVVNWPIQGTAFHCLLWTVNEIRRKMKTMKLHTKMIGQIHDCCLLDTFTPEKHILMELCQKVATIEIREANPWINVPLLIEWEESQPNKSWADKIEIEMD